MQIALLNIQERRVYLKQSIYLFIRLGTFSGFTKSDPKSICPFIFSFYRMMSLSYVLLPLIAKEIQ